MNRIYEALSKMTFSLLYDEKQSECINDGINFTMKHKSRPTAEAITFNIKKGEHTIYVTDNGSTLRNLDQIFELSEPCIVDNIKKVMEYYGFRKQGYELIFDIRPFGSIMPQLMHFLSSVRFLYLMIVFYL